MQPLIPECLTLDAFDEKWAFLAVAMVQTENLGPKGFLKFMENFFLIGYPVFVRYRDRRGKNLRGPYILKSETDKRTMEFFGNMFPRYNYTTTDIGQTENRNSRQISSKKSDFKIDIENPNGAIELPENSPFHDWKQARRFAGPLPFTFTDFSASKEVLIIEGVRQHWKPAPVSVIDYHFLSS